MTVNDGGRLGNLMGEYATLFGHSRRLGITAFVTAAMKEKLLRVFRNASISSEAGLKLPSNWRKVTSGLCDCAFDQLYT